LASFFFEENPDKKKGIIWEGTKDEAAFPEENICFSGDSFITL
jgi:hypothetical protein